MSPGWPRGAKGVRQEGGRKTPRGGLGARSNPRGGKRVNRRAEGVASPVPVQFSLYQVEVALSLRLRMYAKVPEGGVKIEKAMHHS